MENFNEALAASPYHRVALRMTKSPSRIVISSEAEKSFLQTDERCMLENTQHQGVDSVQADV